MLKLEVGAESHLESDIHVDMNSRYRNSFLLFAWR